MKLRYATELGIASATLFRSDIDFDSNVGRSCDDLKWLVISKFKLCLEAFAEPRTKALITVAEDILNLFV